eukprot:scaffold2456_cov129-Isochrysis_galbana.AAC.1
MVRVPCPGRWSLRHWGAPALLNHGPLAVGATRAHHASLPLHPLRQRQRHRCETGEGRRTHRGRHAQKRSQKGPCEHHVRSARRAQLRKKAARLFQE